MGGAGRTYRLILGARPFRSRSNKSYLRRRRPRPASHRELHDRMSEDFCPSEPAAIKKLLRSRSLPKGSVIDTESDEDRRKAESRAEGRIGPRTATESCTDRGRCGGSALSSVPSSRRSC